MENMVSMENTESIMDMVMDTAMNRIKRKKKIRTGNVVKGDYIQQLFVL